MLVLVAVALQAWLDHRATHSWRDALWVGVFPLAADDSEAARTAVARLTDDDFAPVSAWLAGEAHRYGLALDEPVHIALYPSPRQPPPQIGPGAARLQILAWSLRLRWYATRALDFGGGAPPRVRLVLLLHDPARQATAPDSHGLEKGLVAIVHGFAGAEHAGTNQLVLAHELLHTLGATDKYDPQTLAPLYPQGYADPGEEPRYPQARTEIMAGRRALSPEEFEMPGSLRTVVVGPGTAKEIGWTR